jgi:hypothetical protein
VIAALVAALHSAAELSSATITALSRIRSHCPANQQDPGVDFG